MDKGLPGDDAQHVDKALRFLADVATNDEVDARVGVGGVEEAVEADKVGGSPKLEDAVDVDEVVKEAAMLVPALIGVHKAEKGEKGREVVVDRAKFTLEEGPSGDKPLFANKDRRHPFCNIL